MSAVILSHCHTLQMMDISPGNETLQSLITLCNSANKVIFIFSLPPSPSFSAGSEPPRPHQPPSTEMDQACVVLSSSDSEPELSRGKAQSLESSKGKQSEEEEEKKREDEPLKDKQKLEEAEEKDKQRFKGKQSAGERGDNVADGGGCLPPDHTQGNPTCNLLLFISREIGLCRIVTCPYSAV